MDKQDMVKPLVITDNDAQKEYTLDFSKDSIRFAENRGFRVDDLGDFPVSKLPEFFYYAFRQHHKNMARSQTDAILEKLGGVSPKMLDRLVALYVQAAATGLTVTDEELEKNAAVTVDFGEE